LQENTAIITLDKDIYGITVQNC